MEKNNANYHSPHFLMLGHDKGVYYYLPREGGQIVGLRADQHVEGKLNAISPLQFWEEHYSGNKKVDWASARNALLCRQHSVGIYDQSRLRGCGAWWDNGYPVLHLGDRLIVNGVEKSLLTPGKYIYEKAIPFSINHKDPLPESEARKLLEICSLIAWEKPINARYLAGWLAIAPICGALNWRPHIWITAAASSGKSWIFSKIINRLLETVVISSQHDTTEASLRQSLNSDSRPLIFDEAESKDKNSQLRMDGVMRLARAASTDNSPPIRKGSPEGIVSLWYIRSAFLFSSISYAVTDKADSRRITPLGIIKDDNHERFEKLSSLAISTIDDKYVNQFLARSIKMIPVIRENARIFSSIAANTLGNQGAGDQIGALLSGAYSLWSDNPVTIEEAKNYIEKQDWSENKMSSEDADESQCFAYIMQKIIKAQTKLGSVERSVAELINISAEKTLDESITPRIAGDILGRHGLRGDPDSIVVSVSHSGIASILKDTPWARNWGRTLKRLPGAKTTDWGIRFGSVKNRGIEIPLEEEKELLL